MSLSDIIKQPLVRHRLRFEAFDPSTHRVTYARSAKDYERAFLLVQVAYLYQGIEDVDEIGMRISEQHVLPESTVLIAYERDQASGSRRRTAPPTNALANADVLVGTMSVIKDSPAGLPLDKDYGPELDALRARGARLAELGAYTVVRRCWSTGVAQLLSVAAARLAFQNLDATHAVIGVHPKAALFLSAAWGYRPLGQPTKHTDLRAPVVLMALERSRCRRHSKRHFWRRLTHTKSPHDLVFDADASPLIDLPAAVPSDVRPERDVFRHLFIERSNRLETLSDKTRSYLGSRRSEETLARITPACDVARKRVG